MSLVVRLIVVLYFAMRFQRSMATSTDFCILLDTTCSITLCSCLNLRYCSSFRHTITLAN